MDMKAWVCRLHHFLEETIFYLPKSNIGSDPKLIHEIPCKSWIYHKTMSISNRITHWKYRIAINI
jgi:hypothetical protein